MAGGPSVKVTVLLFIVVILLSFTGCPTLQITPYDSSGATDGLPVAMVSMECGLDPEINLDRMISYIEEISTAYPDVRLICFGETTLGWYWKPLEGKSYQESVAEPLNGRSIRAVRDLAAEHGVYISLGFAESDDGKLYNSAVIIDPDGDIIAHRRKSDFVPMDCWSGYTPGPKKITTAYIDDVKTAFLICNDFNNKNYQEEINADPEIQLLLLPHATANLEPDFWKKYQYNYKGLWMLSGQRYGEENSRTYYGSWIIDPNGYMAAYSESGPGYFYYEIPVE
jgi:predicted amidohydrolase